MTSIKQYSNGNTNLFSQAKLKINQEINSLSTIQDMYLYHFSEKVT